MTWYIGLYSTSLERNCPTDENGYILGETIYWSGTPQPFSSNDVVIGVTNEDAHTGNYSLKISGTTLDDWASARWYLNIRSKVRVSFWYKPSLIYGTHDETCVFSIIADDSTWPVKIYWNEDGTFYGVHNVLGMMGSLNVCPPGEWVHIGIMYFNHPIHGRYGLWINGKEVFFFSGNTNTSTYRDLYNFYFGSYPHDVSRNQGTPIGAYYDSLKYETGIWSDNDDIPTDSRLLDLAPDGDGHYTEWAQSKETPPLTTLYEAVNTVQPSADTPNIKAWDNDQYVSFTMQDIANVDGLDIPAIVVRPSMKRNVQSSPYLYAYILLRSGNDDLLSTLKYITTSWKSHAQFFNTDAGYNNWTKDSINAMEIGIKTIPQ